jgi:hypothetical protein
VELGGKRYDFIINEPYQWSTWAALKKADGTLDHDNALIGDDLIEFVNDELFPFLWGIKQRITSPNTMNFPTFMEQQATINLLRRRSQYLALLIFVIPMNQGKKCFIAKR